jgi:hypothetical protein
MYKRLQDLKIQVRLQLDFGMRYSVSSDLVQSRHTLAVQTFVHLSQFQYCHYRIRFTGDRVHLSG